MEETPADKLRHLGEYSQNRDLDEGEKAAVQAILSGEVAAAITQLQKIEQESPGKYSTAANLGTAYELAGDNRNALKWIQEGIRRNAGAHDGTEWLHVLILETKLRLEAAPDFLKSHRIIPLPNKFTGKTKIDIGGAERSINEIMWAIGHQLSERVIFVKAPDPIVADLLFTLGLCEAHTSVVENARKPLEKSREYGFQDTRLLAATEEHYRAVAKTAGAKRWAWRIAMGLAVAVGFPGFLYYCYRRKWFFLTTAAQRRYLEEREAERNGLPKVGSANQDRY